MNPEQIPNSPSPDKSDLICVELQREDETYVVAFSPKYRAEALQEIGKMAADPELSFTWYEASLLIQMIRKTISDSE